MIFSGPVRPLRSPPVALGEDRPHCRSAPATPTSPSVSGTTIWRSWIGATSGLGSVVSSVNASPPALIGRHRPAKQNHSSLTFVNFHFVFGDFVPVNSKKCDPVIRQRSTGNRRPSERKLMTGGPLGRAGGKPHRNS